jgi:hypothetical protein
LATDVKHPEQTNDRSACVSFDALLVVFNEVFRLSAFRPFALADYTEIQG